MSILDDNILEKTSITENILKDFPDLQDVKYTVDHSFIPVKIKDYLEWNSKWFKSILPREMDTVRLEWLSTSDSNLVIRFMDSKSDNFSSIRMSNYSKPDKNQQLAITLLNNMKEHIMNIPKLLDFLFQITGIWVTEEQVRETIGMD